MSLLLAVETSSDSYRVVLGRDRTPVFDSAQSGPSNSKNIAALVSLGLQFVGARVTDIRAIALDVGPGGLSHVRSGVSFANAFSFSLGIAIYTFNSFQVIGSQARQQTFLPVLCAIPAASDHAYVGLVSGPSVEVMRFGPLPSVVAELSASLTEVAVAGRIRHRLSSLLPELTVFDTGIEKPDARVLLDMGYHALEHAGTGATQASPLNEQAAIFYE